MGARALRAIRHRGRARAFAPARKRSRRLSQIGYLFGSDDQSGVALQDGPDIVCTGSTDVRLLRDDDGTNFRRIHIPANFKRMKRRPSLEGLTLILNLVSDPDQNPIVLEEAAKFLRPFAGRVLNPPAAVRRSTRDAVAARLAGIDGLVVPAVARFSGRPGPAAAAIARTALRFPAILRVAGTHAGRIVGVMPDIAAVMAHIAPDQTYLLTEFVDYRAADGLHHKLRVFFFGEHGVIRHRLVSDHWSVHAADRARVLAGHADAIAQERALVTGGLAALPAGVAEILHAIRARLALDIFGIDFAILADGRVLLFEANATMNFFPFSPDPLFAYAGAALDAGRMAFNRLLAPPA